MRFCACRSEVVPPLTPSCRADNDFSVSAEELYGEEATANIETTYADGKFLIPSSCMKCTVFCVQ